MKKYILSLILLLTLFINSSVNAEESVVFSDKGIDIKSDSFTTINNKINFIKGSNMFVTLINTDTTDYEDKEPKLVIEILDNQNNTVWIASNPKTKAPDPQRQPTEFDNFLEKNKAFFESVSYENNILNIKIPLNLSGGEYDLKIRSTNYPEIVVDYKFIISNSSYNFTNSEITIEDDNVSANIGYESLLGKDENNKVVITLSQEGNELFKKEIEKTFYINGVISVNEKVDAIKNLKGDAVLKINILDKDGIVLLSKEKKVVLDKSEINKIYYILLIVLILLLIIILMIFKKKKQKMLAIMMVLILVSAVFVGFKTVRAVTDVEACGPKPANYQINDTNDDGSTSCHIIKWACQRFFKNGTCIVNDDIRAKKYFSSGEVVNIVSPNNGDWVGPITANINVCEAIAGSFPAETNFYVISDSYGSAWSNKRFHVFRFTKGHSDTITFGPNGEKSNMNRAVYNGNCNVEVSGWYKGPSSDFKNVNLKIVEVGKLSTDVCKSIVVNRDFFESNVDSIFDKADCTDKQLRNTFISGSKTFPSVYNTDGTSKAAWHDKSINICTYLGETASSGKNFYIVMDQLGSWKHIRYPVFQFKFGVAENRMYNDIKSGKTKEWLQNNSYYYGGDKENVPGAKYDGNCTVTFRLDNRGDSTDSWDADYELIEAGLTADATCYDPEMIKPTTLSNYTDKTIVYKLDGRGISPYQIEYQSKVDADGYNASYTTPNSSISANGKYGKLSPFFEAMIAAGKTCKPIGQCTAGDITGNWISYSDGTTCTPPPVTVTKTCEGRNLVTRTNGSVTATETNSSQCTLSATCTVVKNETSTSYTFAPVKAVGNVEYKKDGTTLMATTPKTGSYTYTTPTVSAVQTVNMLLTDLYDNSSVIKSCNNGYVPSDPQSCEELNNCPPSVPPVINLTKDPKISLNKNGNCTITWDIQNMPESTTCQLTGWNIGGTGVSSYPISLVNGISGGNKTVTGLTKNEKYVVSCSGSGLTPSPMTTSVICRVNSTIQER